MAIEEPAYSVRLKEDAFEVRTYGERVIAETLVEGTLSEASNAGFRKVAGYIFGANRSREGSKTEIAMTAPVMVSPSQKIAMTAPVVQAPRTSPRAMAAMRAGCGKAACSRWAA